MNHSKLKTALLAAMTIASFCATQTARSETRRLLNDINLEESKIEIDSRYIDTDDGNELKLQLEGEFELNDRWTLGAELAAERKSGESLEEDSARIRAKWRSPRNKQGVAYAIQGGLGYSFADSAAIADARLYLGWKSKDWSVVSRFDMEQLLDSGSDLEFGYRLQAAREMKKNIDLGLEVAGDIASGGSTKHRAGPFIVFPLGSSSSTTLELGAYAGLTSESPDMTYRIKFEFEL